MKKVGFFIGISMIFYSVTVAKCVAEIFAVVPDPAIRVLISDSDFQSYYHSSVTVAYNGREIRYEAEELQKKKQPYVFRHKKMASVFNR